ncbi:hypothetical protein ACLB0R_13725 [Sphingomonas sp. GlSt437]|uniref:hypothetical protein n=1 Tax=Sphingomonas sp. GlSt437 TaxID=3389970 RepID=UPI003A8615E6
MLTRGDAGALLIRAIEADARRRGIAAVVSAATAKRWASATFNGMRHELILMLSGTPTTENWLAGLPEAEFNLPGHLVADLAIDATRRDGTALIATLAALTVEDA